jgi:3-hydroxybutyryl-CoA dehydrogenase
MICGIIGAGTMGRGIAQLAATAGWEVRLVDNHKPALVSAQKFIQKMLNRQVEKGRLSGAEATAIFGRVYILDKLFGLEGCDLIIEAIVEDIEIKRRLFQQLEKIVSNDCILASNTSSLSITSIAGSLKMPERAMGLHFFNPAPLMKLVEIVPAIQTSENTFLKSKAIIEEWGKLPVKVKDTPGFIVNRLARPFYGEALRILEEGIASVETIDWAMKELGGFRMGPFELMDYIGNDINYKVTKSVFESFYYDPRYKPSIMQLRLVEAGFLGRKSERGFYNYLENATKTEPVRDNELANLLVERIVVMLINEAADALYLKIASRDDLDLAMEKGVNYPQGLLKWADKIGISNCVDLLDSFQDLYKEDRYRCSPLLRRMAIKQETFYS